MTQSLQAWEQFATYDNFLLAWQRTVNTTSRMMSDDLGLRAFAYNLEANLRDLLARVNCE